MEMIEPTDPYEQGFIDGMAKQRDSAVQRFVEGGTPDSELAEHKRIIREQQAEIEQLKALAISLSHRNANIQYTKAMICNKCNGTEWVCEWHPDKEAHMCCGGAGMPCECSKGEA